MGSVVIECGWCNEELRATDIPLYQLVEDAKNIGWHIHPLKCPACVDEEAGL